MGTIKTKVTDENVLDFIDKVEHEGRKKDALTLLKMFSTITKEKPKMWGTSMIGFGSYHYKSERSNQEGDWPLTGFSPRKQSLTLYVLTGIDGTSPVFKKLGKHKTSVGCLYINNLKDIDIKVLEEIIRKSFDAAKKLHAKSLN